MHAVTEMADLTKLCQTEWLFMDLAILTNCSQIRQSDFDEFSPFLTRELRACARASYRYDVGNSIRSLARSLDWSIPVNFF